METNEVGFNPENLSKKEREEILRSAREKLENLSKGNHVLSFYRRVFDRAKELQTRYPDYEDYELYHLLIGSTVYDRSKFDFPGEDSVEKFIDSEFEKQQSERADNRPE